MDFLKKWFGSQTVRDNIVWLCWSVLYAFSYPTYNCSFFIWFCFVPVFLFASVRPAYLTFRYSFLYSLLFFFLAYFWLYGFWLPGLFLVLPLLSAFQAFFFYAIAIVSKKLPKYRWIIIPVFWISLELLRSTGFHGFQWNLIGDSQYKNLLFIQSADIFGVWGVSFLIILVNSVIADFIAVYLAHKDWKEMLKPSQLCKGIVLAALLVLNLTYGVVQLKRYQQVSADSKKERLALLQPNIGSHDAWWKWRWENYGIFWKLHAEAMLEKPDMIVWCETMVRNYIWYYLNNYSPAEEVNLFNIRFVHMPKEFGVPILVTSPASIDGKVNYNSADYIDPETNVIQNNSKIHLVPFGEWMPGYDLIPYFKKVMDDEGAGSFTPSKNYDVIKGRKAKFRVLVCYEDVFASLARKFVKRGVNYFVNVTNDGWAYKLGMPHPMWQHLAGATLNAVTVRRPIARAANTGVTGIIDLTGSFKGITGDYQRGFYVGDVPIVDEKIWSGYVRYGYLFPYAMALLTFVIFFYCLFKKKAA